MQWDVFWENKDYQQATDLPATKADPKNLIAMNANHPANVKIIYPDAAWNPLSCDCELGSFKVDVFW